MIRINAHVSEETKRELDLIKADLQLKNWEEVFQVLLEAYQKK